MTERIRTPYILLIGGVFLLTFFAGPSIDSMFSRGALPRGSGWNFLYGMIIFATSLIGPLVVMAFGGLCLLLAESGKRQMASVPLFIAASIMLGFGAAYIFRLVAALAGFMNPVPWPY